MNDELRLIGRCERRTGRAVAPGTAVATAKALDLLRLVAADDDQPRRAGHYVALLWPDVDEARGRGSLRAALAHLRRGLGADLVVRDGELLRMGSVRVDLHQVRDAARRVEALEAAGADAQLLALVQRVERAHGADLAVSETSCAAVFAVRDELRETRCRMLLSGSAAALRSGRSTAALQLARVAEEVQPGEAAARATMAAYAALGETGRAVEAFERLDAFLGSTYGVAPSAETRAAYLAIVTGATERATPAPSEPEHHPEAAEAVARAVRRLLTGPRPGGVVWVVGEPGSGRDSLARHARRRLADSAPAAARATALLAERVVVDPAERTRLHQDCRATGRVAVVPVRRPVPPRPELREASVELRPLERDEAVSLVRQTLRCQPSDVLMERILTTSGGLAGVLVAVAADVLTGAGVGLTLLPPRSADIA